VHIPWDPVQTSQLLRLDTPGSVLPGSKPLD
jgi:hypothetical protein